MDYFEKLQELLKLERTEDLLIYTKLTEFTSVSERRANGLAWYPIAIRGTEPSKGDYINVEFERTTHHELSHQIRFGSSIALFSNHDPKDRIEGTVTHQGGNRLKALFRTEELPDWSRDGKLGIDLLFDNNSYDEMQQAMKQAAAIASNTETGNLIKILTSSASPSFNTLHNFPIRSLNDVQQSAVHKILAANELAIVHGPPGTGKTTTLVQAIKSLLKQQKQQILVVAPSNTAVDLLSEKLSNEGISVTRIGNPSRVSAALQDLTLDSKISRHEDMKLIKGFKKQASEYKNMAHKYKRNFGRAEKEQRKALFDEAHKLMKEVSKIEEYLINDVLTNSEVVTATLVGANHHTIRKLRYQTLIIDEAGQALEPACWIPILKAGKVILAGDHCQLPPTIKSNLAATRGLQNTLLEKLVKLHPDAVVLLDEQYRMHRDIMGYSSSVFYQNKLKANESVADQLLFNDDKAIAFIDTAGCSFEEKLDGTSLCNPEEAAFLFKQLHRLAADLGPMDTTDFPSIAVISPYKQQVLYLQELLRNSPDLEPYVKKISINTIDSFQGQERDVVFISMTRSNNEGNIGFLSDIRRMNVAMTRARKKLVVIGDSATLSRLPFYADFISYAEDRKAYQSAWEFVD